MSLNPGLFTYRIFQLLLNYVLIYFFYILPSSTKLGATLRFRRKNKFNFKDTYQPKNKSIGFHAASGEIEYAYPIISEIKTKHPEYNIVVTLSSDSVLTSALKNPLVDAVGPAPMDDLISVNRFLSQFDFHKFAFARTDVWPELSIQLKKRNIPTLLFSATFSADSSRLKFPGSILSHWALDPITQIHVVSESDKLNLAKIFIKKEIYISGDSRYDQVHLKQKLNPPHRIPIIQNNKPLFVMGSTWPQDEDQLIPVLKKLSETWKFVFAPHEATPARVQNLKEQLESQNLKVSFFSQNEATDFDVMIVDKYGVLFYLYELADMSFVGGSFKDKVHSVMEPLSYLSPVLVGPRHVNNREAVEFSKLKSNSLILEFVKEVKSSAEIINYLKQFQKLKSEEKVLFKSLLSHEIKIRQGATGVFCQFLLS